MYSKSSPNCEVDLTLQLILLVISITSEQLERAVTCEHCDVDAYYKLTIEYFNDCEILTTYLCIKCVKIESKKVVDDFPSIRSLRVEPIIHPAILII